MASRFTPVSAALLSLVWAAPVLAQAPDASTSGPGAGSDVKPSTAIQNEYVGSPTGSGASANKPPEELGTPAAAGVPGAEGQPGTQSGRSAK